jgi:hypothetical protein
MGDSAADILKTRLTRGSDALRVREDRGDTGLENELWLASWFKLLDEYKAVDTRQTGSEPDPQEPSSPALDVAMRVAMQPQARLDTAADVYRLARQLDIFAGGDPIVGLPTRR